MRDRRIKWAAIAIAAVHTLLLLAYTLPARWVPVRLRYWSQAYARVPFHQDWRLFAPDPPACGCAIEVTGGTGLPVIRLEDMHGGFIWERMAANACRFGEASIDRERGKIVAGDALGVSLVNMTGRDPRFDGSRIDVHLCCACRGAGIWQVRLRQDQPE